MKLSPLSRLNPLLLLVLCAALATGCASSPRPFATPEAASDALVAALRTNDTKEMSQILGPDSQDLLDSGDPVADQFNHSQFLHDYDQKHSLQATDETHRTLVIGANDWPMPIPIVQKKDVWSFDTAAGKDEILNRRIGNNELSAIQVCLAIVDAQHEYATKDWGDGSCHYAMKILSDPGKKNGLYWQTAEGEPASPLGPLVATAEEQGYKARAEGESPKPYHGYYYRLLTAQGDSAKGGALNYLVDGKLVAGFAVVAWPATYENSGVMSFIVNQDGVVYQRNLGDDTEQDATAMTAFDPDQDWTAVENPPATQP
jgi:hypothetical protein